jgi:hypothetical protein
MTKVSDFLAARRGRQGLELECGKIGSGASVVEIDQIDPVRVVVHTDRLGTDAAQSASAVIDHGDTARACTPTRGNIDDTLR